MARRDPLDRTLRDLEAAMLARFRGDLGERIVGREMRDRAPQGARTFARTDLRAQNEGAYAIVSSLYRGSKISI